MNSSRTLASLAALVLTSGAASAHAGHNHFADNAILHHAPEFFAVALTATVLWLAFRLLPRLNEQRNVETRSVDHREEN